MFVQLTHSSLRASHSWWWKTSISSLDRLWKTLVYPLICCSFLLIFTKGRTCQRWDHQNNLLTNTSFFFLLLSLFQVVYCLHELARVAFANKWVTFQIVDKTGQYEFGQEELRQAAIDRNTTSTFKKKKKTPFLILCVSLLLVAEIEQVSKGSRLMRPTAPPPVDQDKLAREAQEAENKRRMIRK